MAVLTVKLSKLVIKEFDSAIECSKKFPEKKIFNG
jgi:hypothetical protein